ncbi:hypothetical protein BsWGS_06179 [Bradybaena similaris]
MCSTYDDIRAGECAVWDSLQIRYGTHKWQPFEGQNASSMCQQTCKSFYTNEIVTIDVDVADGALCTYSAGNSNMCMGGKCLTVGCDGKIKSTKKVDACGVCDGDGSECKTVHGDFVKKPASGEVYVLAVTVPSGARHIKIEKTKQSAQFLAIQTAKYGTYVLNGDKRQSGSQKLVINGAMFEYTRSSGGTNEMISSIGPLRGNIHIMVYPNKVMESTSVHFNYTVHKSDVTLEMNKYKWKFEKWSTCSVTCGQGVQTIIYGCYDKDSDAKVNDESCSLLKPPRKDEVRCVREACGEIRYNYAMSNNYEECDAKCGQTGVQVQKFYCEKLFQNNGTYEPASARYCEHLIKPNITRLCNGKECATKERFQWLAFETWTECPCGGPGIETRDVYCEKVIYTVNGEAPDVVERVSLDLCRGVPGKLESNRPCKGKPCVPKFQWVDSGLHTACSAPCGENGTQEAILECEQITITSGVEFFEIADEHFCADIPRPETDIRTCTSPACEDQSEAYEWQATEQWTDCSAECGKNGTQIRLYHCQKVGQQNTDNTFNEEFCQADQKLNETRGCSGPLCPLKWSTEKWSECSVTCGRGKHYRNVFCGDPHTEDDDYRCTDTPPATSKFCYRKDCPAPITLGKWSKAVSLQKQEPQDEDCSDKYSFCKVYKALEHRCKRDVFRRKCCRSCINFERSANLPKKTVRQNRQKTTSR